MTDFNSGLTWVRDDEIYSLASSVARQGYRVYSMTTAGGSGRAAFFNAVRAALPLDPPVVSSNSLDALSDSLWGGIHSTDDQKIAIIWEDSLRFFEDSPEEFKDACSVLAEVAESLADETFAVGRPKQVRVFVSRE
ncbi:barstar family protein [Streptomyces zaomyceticus]|uniref:barstar family protein n=1 Tax=Streptomyces zaomyceticus TaxID=68286 RepID=UPI0036ADCEE1